MLNSKTPDQLRSEWQELKTQFPHLYPRDAAAKLGVSEAQLIALGTGKTSFRLTAPDITALLKGLNQFGAPLFIVRNEDAVLEREATLAFTEKEHHITATNSDVCLAFGKNAIASIFAVHAEKFVRRGIQFFDAAGTAVFKAYVRDESQIEAFDAWIKPWISENQSDEQPVSASAEAPSAHGHAGCSCSCGSHGKPGVETVSLAADSFKTLLKTTARSGQPLTLGLANAHALFSVSAPVVKKVAPAGPWFNVLDDVLHSHLREEAVKSGKATVDAGKNTFRATFANAAGAPLFWIRVAADSEAAGEVLQGGRA